MRPNGTPNGTTYFTNFNSPIGDLLLTGNGETLTGVWMQDAKYPERPGPQAREDASVFKTARQQLDAYFAGELTDFDLPLSLAGTEFQQRVWKKLCEIPYGKTWSYAQLAGKIGNPKASRAVGLANGRNPIPIIVPCHRVIGANGTLTGYGGGLPRKHWLLAHEQRHRAGDLFSPR